MEIEDLKRMQDKDHPYGSMQWWIWCNYETFPSMIPDTPVPAASPRYPLSINYQINTIAIFLETDAGIKAANNHEQYTVPKCPMNKVFSVRTLKQDFLHVHWLAYQKKLW